MRRWLTIVLLVLMPLQLSWAVAARYCGHEQKNSVQHFGHHQHQHEHAQSSDPASDDGGLLTVDDDCSVCHLGCGQLMQTATALLADTGNPGVVADHPTAVRSHIPPGSNVPTAASPDSARAALSLKTLNR